jgi:3-oxoacyl-[acyl-carrier protein] reductase
MEMDLGIRNRVAVITGAARGIGLAEALALAGEGVHIAVNDLDADRAREAVDALRKQGVEAAAFIGDAADENTVQNLIAEVVDRFGRLDILVNNAGVAIKPSYRAEEMPVEAWDHMIRVHLRSTFLWSRAAIPHMRKNAYGRIINTSSMNYTGGGRPGVSHYTSAKAGIAGFTRNLAKEVGDAGITVNAIAPGYVETEMISSFTLRMHELLCEQNPTGRTCSPGEVAMLVAYLSSSHAGFINGELVCIDGGRREFFWEH